MLSERYVGSVPREISYQRAKQTIEKALQLDPELAETYLVLGLNEVQGGKERVTAFEKAIELDPNFAGAYAWLSSVLTGPDAPKRRLSLREKAVKLNPMSVGMNGTYALALVDFGRFEEAEQVIQHMKEIDPNRLDAAYYNLRQRQHRYGEATYHALKRVRYSSGQGPKTDLAENYDRLGLNQLTADIFEDTRWEFLGLAYTNWELATTEARASVPNSDADVSGAWFRAFGEYSDENYADAIKYFLLSDFWCTNCNALIFSYLQVGDIESARPLLDQRKRNHQNYVNAGANSVRVGFNTIIVEIDAMDLALLDSDPAKAIGYLKMATDKGLILGRMY